mgnify:FL=1
MLPISTIVLLLLGHWVANSFCQPKHITIKTTWDSRLINSIIYTCVLGLFSYWVVPLFIFYWFIIINGLFHYIINTYFNNHLYQLYKNNKYEVDELPSFSLFNTISIIHVLQYIILFSSYVFLMS